MQCLTRVLRSYCEPNAISDNVLDIVPRKTNGAWFVLPDVCCPCWLGRGDHAFFRCAVAANHGQIYVIVWAVHER